MLGVGKKYKGRTNQFCPQGSFDWFTDPEDWWIDSLSSSFGASFFFSGGAVGSEVTKRKRVEHQLLQKLQTLLASLEDESPATETAWHCGTDRAFEWQLVVVPSALNCLPVREHRPLLMLRCLGRLPCNANGRGRRIMVLRYNPATNHELLSPPLLASSMWMYVLPPSQFQQFLTGLEFCGTLGL